MIDFVKKLKNQNIQISLAGNNLRIDYVGEELSNEILQEIKTNKQLLIQHLLDAEARKGYKSIKVSPPEKSYVLSYAQERLLRLSQIEEINIAYNISYAYLFSGPINKQSLELAYLSLIDRHEILRTIFVETDSGEIRQCVIPMNDIKSEFIYIDFSDDLDADRTVSNFLKQEALKPFDRKTPLFKIQFLRLEENSYLINYITHHSICDGWSMGVLIRDLLSYYEATIMDIQNPLPPLRIQYKDYSIWQRITLSKDVLSEAKKYWLERLAEPLPVLELPLDKGRPANRSYAGGLVHKIINKDLTTKFKAILHEERSTLFMGVLALANILLYKYTNQEDIIIGSPVAGREDPDLENQIGMYVNTLALRTPFNGSDNFKTLLQTVKKITLQAYHYGNYPFDKLIDDLDVKIDPSRNALFDVMVVLHNDDIRNQNERIQNSRDFKVEPYKGRGAEYVTSKYDLIFFFTDSNEGLQCGIEYNSDVFYRETIERLSFHLENLMVSVLENPLLALHALQCMSKVQQNELLYSFNTTKAEYPKTKTLAELFEEQVLLTPNHLAVIYEDECLTYKNLNSQSNQLAQYLIATYNITTESCVGIQLNRSAEMIVAILAILKAGGAYVPIDPDYPQERVNYLLTDSGCKVLLDQKELAKYKSVAFRFSMDTPVTINDQKHLAYVIYTSGTTGNPKGVMVTHQNVARLVKGTNYVSINENDKILSLSNFSFDGSVFDIFGSLLNGASLIITSREVVTSPPSLRDMIEKKKISIFFLTTALFNTLVDEGLGNVMNLRCVLFGGEKVSVSHVKKFKARYSEVKLVHVYGPTENTTFSTYYDIDSIQENAANIPIGKGISNTSCYILSKEMQLQPFGVYGELYVGGDGLSRGYINNPKLTESKFVPHPFAVGFKLYKTGDIARWLPGGNIEFLGRNDDQVKIRGFRIELGEIERALAAFEKINDVVLLAREEAFGAKELVAYYTASEQVSTTELRTYLSKRLPTYMIPAYFLQMKKLPLTVNGKVDRNELSAIGLSDIHTGTEYVAPDNGIEATLLDIWSDVLAIERKKIGMNDDFFLLGGHSLKATIILSKIRSVFGINVNLLELYSEPTIRALAKEISRRQWALRETNENEFDIQIKV